MPTSTVPIGQNTGSSYKWIVTLVVIFGAFMSILDQTIVNIAIPRLEVAFRSNLDGVQWVLTAYILTQGVITPTTAFFTDRLGSKRFYIIALSIFTLGSALCGIAWSLPALIFFRILQGVGGAYLFPLAITMLYREFPPQQRGLASGLFGVAALLAPAVGPTLGGYFVTYMDWPLIFYVNVPLGIIGVILAVVLLRDIRSEGQTRFDFPGFLLAAAGLASVLYGLSDASTDGWGSVIVLGTLIGGVLILGCFVVFELYLARRGKQPLLDLSLFLNGPFLTSNITNVLVTFAFFGGIFLLPIYLQNLRGLNAFQSGLLLLPQAFASIITAFVGGRIVDRFGSRVVVIPGLIFLAVASWQLTYIGFDTSYWWLQALFILRGLGLGLIIQPLSVSALSAIHPRKFAQASSLYTVIRFVSTSLGIAVLATLLQTRVQDHATQIASQITPASPLGQLADQIQWNLVVQGVGPIAAKMKALQQIGQQVQAQGSLLGLQDTFWFILCILIASIIAACFMRSRKQMPAVSHAAEDETSMPLIFE